MTAVASEGVPGTRHRLRQRLRSTVLGPRGGGTTRRRASDAFRLALAVVVVLVSIPVMRANSAAELSVVRAVHPPPAAISWLVTTVFWLGSAGVIVLLVIVGLLVPRLTAVRRAAVAALPEELPIETRRAMKFCSTMYWTCASSVGRLASTP